MMEREMSLTLFLTVLLWSLLVVNPLFAQEEVSFRKAGTFSVERHPSSVTVGDFNGDRIPDLAVANLGGDCCPYPPGTVSILLGNGDGAFQAAQNFRVGVRPGSVTVGDFNGDTLQDLAVANELSNNVSILLGNEDGTFQAAQDYRVGRAPRSVTVGDFNGDAIQDLAVANGFSDDLSILLGKGDGTFQEAQNHRVGVHPSSITVGDFNGDKIQDLAVTTTNSEFFDSSIASLPPLGDVFILLGNGDGTFQAVQNYRAERVPWAIAVGDFNGDKIQDLAVLHDWSSTVLILLGAGDGAFQSAGTFRVGFRPLSMAIGDFNTDGIQDLVIAASGNTQGTKVAVLLGNGDGTFRAAQFFEVGRFPISVAVGDFDGDGLQDLAVVNWLSDEVLILINNSQ